MADRMKCFGEGWVLLRKERDAGLFPKETELKE